MAIKKLLTLEQLVQFCTENKYYSFSSKDSGYTLSVQVPGSLVFSSGESEDLLYTNVRVCHTELNRNGSFISEDNMKKAMPTLAYKPLLASIVETLDGWDFNGHDMEITEDSDGNPEINYIEKQVGTFTTLKPYLEYDPDMDKTYVIAEAVIPRGYTKAAEIIERKKGTKVSCELCINSMSYNAKEKYLELEDFYFAGVTCLGESVGEGMLGSRLDIKDFSTANNSVHYEQDDKLVEVLEKLNNTLSNFNIESQRKEDIQLENQKEIFEEVADAEEEVTVTEEPTEEEAAAEEEISEDATDVTPEEVAEEITEDDAETVEESEESETVDVTNSVEFAITKDGETKSFSLSLNDKIIAMYNLVNDTYSDVDNDYYDVSVYEDEKIVEMYSWWSGKAYRQSYKVKKDSYSLVGDRVEIFAKYLTQDEINALENMKSNYSIIEDKLAKYESEPQKMEILESDDYGYIRDTEEFTALKERDAHFDLTVDEVKEKADAILLQYAKQGAFTFASQEDEVQPKVNVKVLPTETKKTGRYGDLFK